VTLSVISLLLAHFLAIKGYANTLIALTSRQAAPIKNWQRESLGVFELILIVYAIFFFMTKHYL